MRCMMKQYNNEKAVISLTSWKGRINTVGLTIYSIAKSCPGFHIVLVLSSEEFPGKEIDLPNELQKMLRANIFELLWIQPNYKVFKKILFTSQRYHDIPVISADDDLLYTKNYAELLYRRWCSIPTSCVGLSSNRVIHGKQYDIADLWGYAQLFPPNFSQYIDFNLIPYLVSKGCIDDDELYNQMRIKHKVNAFSFQLPFIFNGYAYENPNASQHTSITKQRLNHKINDSEIYKVLL